MPWLQQLDFVTVTVGDKEKARKLREDSRRKRGEGGGVKAERSVGQVRMGALGARRTMLGRRDG